MGLLGMYATIAAWRHARPWLEEVLAHLDEQRHYLADVLPKRFPELGFRMPDGTYFAWLDFRALELAKTPAAHLYEHGKVALSDGYHFGEGWEGFARLNFATSREILDQVLDRMATGLGR